MTSVSKNVPAQYAGYFNGATSKYGLPDGLLGSMASAESNFNPNAKSGVGAIGIMQFMPATAKGYGIDPADPAQSIDAAGKMMSGLIAKYGGDLQKALAGYNWGGGNVDKAIKQWGSSWLSHAPKETQDYIKKIMG